jgi:hypothetical protein
MATHMTHDVGYFIDYFESSANIRYRPLVSALENAVEDGACEIGTLQRCVVQVHSSHVILLAYSHKSMGYKQLP